MTRAGAPDKESFAYAVAFLLETLRRKGMSYENAVNFLSTSMGGRPSARTIKRHYGEWKDVVTKFFYADGHMYQPGLENFFAVVAEAIDQELKAGGRVLARDIHTMPRPRDMDAIKTSIKGHIHRRGSLIDALDAVSQVKVK